MKRIFLLSFIFSAFFVSGQKSIYVSPTGSDSNNGSEYSPFKTVQKAFDESKKITSQKVNIILRGGIYRLEKTIELDESFSRNENSTITLKSYDGEEAIIRGSRQLKNWKKNLEGFYEADALGLEFRQMYINGKKAIRAKYPDYGKKVSNMSIACQVDPPSLRVNDKTQDEGPDLRNTDVSVRLRFGGVKIRVGEDFIPTNLSEMAAKKPTTFLKLVDESAKKSIFGGSLSEVCVFWNMQGGAGWFENSKALLNVENEWYLDKENNKVLYIPPAGVDMSKAVIEAPKLERLFSLNKAKNINFEGIIFENTHFGLKNNFHFATQGNMDMQFDDSHKHSPWYTPQVKHDPKDWVDILPPAAIELENTKNISFKHNVIRNTGGMGLSLRYGEENIKIIGNVIHTTGGNGIAGAVSPNYRNDDLPIAKNILISNNYIGNIGTELFGSCGIAFFFSHDLTIEHNEIYALSYQAIHTGWQRSSSVGRTKNLRILNNNVHHHLYINNDGGAIHHVYPAAGDFILEGNYIHSPADKKYRGHGDSMSFYMDGLTTNAYLNNNVSPNKVNIRNAYMLEPIQNFTTKKKRIKKVEVHLAKEPSLKSISIGENHFTSKHKNSVKQTMSQNKVDAVIKNAGVTKEYEFMKKYAPTSNLWEYFKEGNRYN